MKKGRGVRVAEAVRQKIVEDLKLGYTYDEISARHSVCPKTVGNVLHDAGVRGYFPPVHRAQSVVAAIEAGAHLAEISRAVSGVKKAKAA